MPRKQQPWKSLMPGVPAGATPVQIACAVEACRRPFKSIAGLTSHMRSAHLDHYRRYGMNAAPVRAALPLPPLEEVVSIESEFASAVSALQLLDTAIKSLRERLGVIDAEVLRLTALQAEREVMESQINALATARMAFEDAGVGAARTAGAR